MTIQDSKKIQKKCSHLSSSLLEPFTLQDVVDVCCFSREAVAKLPNEESLRKHCIDEHALPLLIEGVRILHVLAFSGESDQLDAEEIQINMLRFAQIESILGVETTQLEGRSCIATAQAEKKECQNNCEKRFCGCFWNSFLTKTDCLVNIGGGGLPGG